MNRTGSIKFVNWVISFQNQLAIRPLDINTCVYALEKYNLSRVIPARISFLVDTLIFFWNIFNHTAVADLKGGKGENFSYYDDKKFEEIVFLSNFKKKKEGKKGQ